MNTKPLSFSPSGHVSGHISGSDSGSPLGSRPVLPRPSAGSKPNAVISISRGLHDLAHKASERQHHGFSCAASIRADIWLWQARFFKSRALSAKMVRSGRIRLYRDGTTTRLTKPHTKIRPSDTLVFMQGSILVHIQIKHIGTRRGPAAEAVTLYQKLENQATLPPLQGLNIQTT